MASRQARGVLNFVASSLVRSSAAPRALIALPYSAAVRAACVSSATRAGGVRALHASPPSRSSALIGALQSELTYEKEEYVQPEEVAGGLPNGFTLTESQGDCLVTLTKEHQGETVTIELIAGSETEDEEFEIPDHDHEAEEEVEEGPAPATPFSVSIVKGDTEMRFEVRVRGDGSMEVDEVTLSPADEDEEAFNEVPYQGPRFEELDEGLQAELLHYLDERGVNADLAVYITALNFDKEQREYTQWLERMQAFVAQKA
ncbi:CGL104 [Auxenochlorella protothecoides x Auxenochlorella symbiontica]